MSLYRSALSVLKLDLSYHQQAPPTYVRTFDKSAKASLLNKKKRQVDA